MYFIKPEMAGKGVGREIVSLLENDAKRRGMKKLVVDISDKNEFLPLLERLNDSLSDAKTVLIGAGAGLSTSAGFTYSGERFEKHFSDFRAKYGFTDMYTDSFFCPLLVFKAPSSMHRLFLAVLLGIVFCREHTRKRSRFDYMVFNRGFQFLNLATGREIDRRIERIKIKDIAMITERRLRPVVAARTPARFAFNRTRGHVVRPD